MGAVDGAMSGLFIMDGAAGGEGWYDSLSFERLNHLCSFLPLLYKLHLI